MQPSYLVGSRKTRLCS